MTTYGTATSARIHPARQNLLARHPLAGFFALAFFGSWVAILPVLLSSSGLGWLPLEVPLEPLRTISTFTGPFLAAFLVTAAMDGQPGVKNLLRRLVHWRVNLVWYLLAFVGFIGMDLLLGMILFGPGALAAFSQKWPLIFTAYLPALLTYRLISALGEETGWTGFAVPQLQKRFRPWVAAGVLGLLWGFWHLPGFFIGGEMGSFNPIGFIFFLINSVAIRIIWTWVANHTQASVLIGTLLHASANTAAFELRPQLYPPAPPEAGLLAIAVYLILALAILLGTRGRLAYRPQS